METTELDKALAETIKSLADITPETIDKVKDAYTAYYIADASVSVWAWSIFGTILILTAIVTLIMDKEVFPAICFFAGILCFIGTCSAIVTLKAPEAYAVKSLTDKVLSKQ